ncbi:YciI-like protein [Pandoraea sp. NPDC090278]|uniref:YciI-like protein n=1 Tax=Pandoraea sp. NPDC090278 TaxID=3364391 RepID=UPI00383BCDA1
MHYLLTYELVDDYLDRRAQYRDAHLALAWAASDRGELLLAGALESPVDTAALLFEGDSPAAAEAFAKADPYVVNGLVKMWRVRPWKTVVGKMASTPVR